MALWVCVNCNKTYHYSFGDSVLINSLKERHQLIMLAYKSFLVIFRCLNVPKGKADSQYDPFVFNLPKLITF